MIYDNRQHAGEVLASELLKLKLNPQRTIIAAIPRGGVVVGAAISKILRISLSAIVIKKIGAPANPELAIGAVATWGKPVLDHWLLAELGVSSDYLRKEIRNKRREAKRREEMLGLKFEEKLFKNKNVIVVDDGLATGQTAKAAAKILKSFGPKKLILAIACGSVAAFKTVSDDYEKVICPQVSDDFAAVGQFYRDFRPIDDEEAKALLAQPPSLTRNS